VPNSPSPRPTAQRWLAWCTGAALLSAAGNRCAPVALAQDGPNAHVSTHDLPATPGRDGASPRSRRPERSPGTTDAAATPRSPSPDGSSNPDAARTTAAAPLFEDPDIEALFHAEVDAAVEQALTARLAGIPRPRYVPATDFLPPKGLVLHATTAADSDFPFALAMSGFVQGRWLQLARGVTEWTDSAGNPAPVVNESEFNLNRVYLQWQGYVGHQQVLYNIALFGTTNGGLVVTIAPVGFVGWAVTREVKIGFGVTQVPGTREWLMSSMWPMGVDRSMVNTFIRPSYSPGFLSSGALLDDTLFYQAGIYNGLDGGVAGIFRTGTAMAWAGNVWWEPLGPFGLGYSDMEHHESPAVRIGTSGVFAKTPATLIGEFTAFPNPENTVARLSDGTPLAEPGALGPNTLVQRYTYHLATFDAGWKYRGWSAFGEYSWRLINGLVGTGPFERTSLFDHGGNLFLGWCFVPRTYELYARSSALTGPYGSAAEYGGGFNWYLHRSRQSRFTFEALWIDGSPAQNPLYPYRAGFTGTAIQTQYVAIF